MTSARNLTNHELAACIKMLRQSRQWTQETLAVLSRLTDRTVQRIERGEGASVTSRRALANAFELGDLDFFNKPFKVPTDEELQQQREQFDRDHMTLPAISLTTGRSLGILASECSMDTANLAFEADDATNCAFAELVDFYREFRDCSDLYTETQKLDVYKELEAMIKTLHNCGVSLRYARRNLKVGPEDAKLPIVAFHLVGFASGNEAENLIVPRACRVAGV